MNYALAEPPVSMDFQSMTDVDAKNFLDWFAFQNKPRLEMLADVVRATPGFENWMPDNTPQSLLPLGEWFKAHAKSRPRSNEEMRALVDSGPDWLSKVNLPNWDLDTQTVSLALDIGMYLCQCLRTNLKGLEWFVETKQKRDADFHFPVLEGFGPMRFNPIRIVQNVSYAFVEDSKPSSELNRIYQYWVSKAVMKAN